MKLMIVLQLHLVAIVLKEPEVDGQLVRIFGRSNAAVAHCPIIPIKFGNCSPGVPARVRGKIIGRVRQKRQIEEALPRVDAEGILVEEVEDAEVAGDHNESSAVLGLSKLRWTRLPHHVVAAKSERLP